MSGEESNTYRRVRDMLTQARAEREADGAADTAEPDEEARDECPCLIWTGVSEDEIDFDGEQYGFRKKI